MWPTEDPSQETTDGRSETDWAKVTEDWAKVTEPWGLLLTGLTIIHEKGCMSEVRLKSCHGVPDLVGQRGT